MRPRSLKSKLLLAVAALVLGSGLVIAFLATQRYSATLHRTMLSQAENLAHSVSLDAADKVLLNDLVALQRMLDQQTQSNPLIAYIFVRRDGRVLAHSFERGVPIQLLEANGIGPENQPRFKEITSQRGETFLDTAWPIYEGKAGVLRLGFSERPYQQQVARLWEEIGISTLGILLVALLGSLLFVRRITRPLAALVQATKEIDRGESKTRVAVQGQDEIAVLANSFNQMVSRQEEYTRRLEDQAMELERAHNQAITACKIVREISGLRTLPEMGATLIGKLQEILRCRHLALLVFNPGKDALSVVSLRDAREIKDAAALVVAREALEGVNQVTFSRTNLFKPPLVPDDFPAAERQALIPFDDGQVSGAIVIACPEGSCSQEETELVRLIVSQNAGALRRAMQHEEEVSALRSRVESAAGFGDLIGKDPKMQVVYQLIEDVAPSDATVLIQGESGTGKELVARAIHAHSPRAQGPFVVINCSAYPATLLESELFGHEKGAFTGALRQKAGRFEQAHGGTVFLDEIGEIPPPAQIKLLRVLQTRKFERLGGEQTLTVDVRILAATHKDLLEEVKKGTFREDLFYRLNVIPLVLPPLRDRRNDIPRLALHFLRRFATERGKEIQIREFSSEALRLLLDYSWPGNVRELENTVEHAVVLAKGSQVEVWDFPSALRSASAPPANALMDQEMRLLLEILEECDWNKKMAAKRLGVSRSTIYSMLRRHNISRTKPTTH
jgi:transcriptional regulator with GAF, ATPase, and Fis domain